MPLNNSKFILLVILFLLITYKLCSEPQYYEPSDSVFLSNIEATTDLKSKYLLAKNSLFILDTLNLDLSNKGSSTKYQILFNLVLGRYFLYGYNRKDDESYKCYSKAHQLANKTKQHIIQYETITNLVEHHLYTKIHLDDIPSYLSELDALTLTEQQKLYSNHLMLLYDFEMAQAQLSCDSDVNNMLNNFSQVLEGLVEQSMWRTASKHTKVYGNLLEYICLHDESIYRQSQSLSFAKLVSKEYYAQRRLVDKVNRIMFELSIKEYQNGINIFKANEEEFKKSLLPDHLVLLYDWISTCYDSLNDNRRTLKYLKLKEGVLNQSNALIEKEKSSVIKLEGERAQFNQATESLYRWIGLLILIAVVISGLAYVIYRYQSLKKKAIESELETTKVKAAYDATVAKMEGEQQERQEIASVLHDQIASLLTAADMHLSAANQKKEDTDNPLLNKAGDIIKDVNSQVRNLSHQLVSPTLLKFGLDAGVSSLAEKMQTENLRVKTTSTIGDKRFAQTKENFIYNTTAELIQNVIKHSNANTVDVTLYLENDQLQLSVKDNGTNATKSESTGLGLTHIQNKAEALGGHMLTEFAESGVAVLVSIPVELEQMG